MNRFAAGITFSAAAGIIAQALLFRELSVAVYTNELLLGALLCQWLIIAALGAAGAIFFLRRATPANWFFLFLEIAFALTLAAAVTFIRSFRIVFAIAPGKEPGLGIALLVCGMSCLIPALIHGALFPLWARVLPGEKTVARAYGWEALGAAGGGVLCSFWLFPHFFTYTILFALFSGCLCIGISMLRRPAKTRLAWCALVLGTALIVRHPLGAALDRIEKTTAARQWAHAGRLLDSRHSRYGHLALIARNGQHTYYYNGTPLLSLPGSDIDFEETVSHLALLAHPSPAQVLLLGQGSIRLIPQILKHPVEKLDYAELDDTLFFLMEHNDPQSSRASLSDPRVNLRYRDGRAFLTETNALYDVILIMPSSPRSLFTNRFLTREFYLLARQHLKPGGIVAAWQDGSDHYLSPQRNRILSSVYAAFSSAYPRTLLLPGTTTVLIGTEDEAAFTKTGDWAEERYSERGLKLSTTNEMHLRDRFALGLPPANWMLRELLPQTPRNSDRRPFGVFAGMAFWQKQNSPSTAWILESVSGIRTKHLLFFLLSAMAFWGTALRRRRDPVSRITEIAVFSTGFWGMCSSMLILCSYQTVQGYIFERYGLIAGLYMAGLGISSFWAARSGRRTTRQFLLRTEIGMVLASFGLLLLPSIRVPHATAVFCLASFAAGLLCGADFAFSSILASNDSGKENARLYVADLAGGCLAALSAGVVLLPVIGMASTAALLAALKACSAAFAWRLGRFLPLPSD